MRRMLLGLAILGSGLARICPAHAGVYNLDPPRSIYYSDYVQAHAVAAPLILNYLGELRAIDDRAPKANQSPEKSLRAGYLRQVTELETKQREGRLGVEDRINLGACLIRLGRLDQARVVLEEADRVVPADSNYRFLILLNLASAYQENDELLPRAIVTQSRALKAWPRVWAGWSSAEWSWYRRVETYALRLMQLRHEEWRSAGGRPVSYQTVDALFPGVRFVGPSGRYEAGAIDFEMWNRLPLDAESIVLQLLQWRPHDNRLYWLYGELLNARGRVDFAYNVFYQLVDSRRQSMPELIAHRGVLREAQESFKKVAEFMQQPTAWKELLWTVAPRGPLLTPGIGSAANEIGWAAAFSFAGQPPPVAATPSPMPAPKTGGWLPDWQQVTVGFVTGIVVALLSVLQWQQWRRRRQVAVLVRESEGRPYG